jgi:hypothetical protein
VESQEAFDQESRRWADALAGSGLDGFPQERLHALIAVQRLAGALDREEAVQAVRTVSDPVDADALNGSLRLLALLHPPTGGAYWGGLSDSLLASLLDALESTDQEFLTRVLLSERLSDRQRLSCLRFLSLTFPARPHRLERAARAVRSRPDLLLRGARQVLSEMPPSTRRQWQAEALAQGPDPAAETTPPPAAEPSEGELPPARPRSGLAPLRDYLGFDVHSWRRVLGTTAALLLLLALVLWVSR